MNAHGSSPLCATLPWDFLLRWIRTSLVRPGRKNARVLTHRSASGKKRAGNKTCNLVSRTRQTRERGPTPRNRGGKNDNERLEVFPFPAGRWRTTLRPRRNQRPVAQILNGLRTVATCPTERSPFRGKFICITIVNEFISNCYAGPGL